MSKQEENSKSITDQLSKLENIVSWFETQKEVDVEKGLDKVKEGAHLIRELKGKLQKVENEFEEIKKDMLS